MPLVEGCKHELEITVPPDAVEQEDVERDDQRGDDADNYGSELAVHKAAHEVAPLCEKHQRNKGERNAEAEDDLAQHQNIGRI